MWRWTIIFVLLAAIAAGVNWMAYEQMRANSGFFIPTPSQVSPPPAL